jgi:rubrerythrin
MAISSGIRKIENPVIEVADFSRFMLLGDPGCDGLGAEIMSVFAEILTGSKVAAKESAAMESVPDFTLVIGDVVPFGSKVFYQNIVDFINVAARNPVYVACGNHDTVYYADFFGRADYAVVDSRTLVIVLDDSKRVISDESRALLETALRDYPRENIILALHIPPPNPVSKNAIPAEEWQKINDTFAAAGCAPDYVLAGHLHSYFEAMVSCGDAQVPLVCSGGAGARIEDVEGVKAPYYHWVEFTLGGKFHHKRVELNGGEFQLYDDTARGEELARVYKESYERECEAHVRYRLYADDAAKRGLPNLAKLFRAASDAEFYHARNFFYCAGGVKEPVDAVASSLAGERFEVEDFYKNGLDLARSLRQPLAVYAFTDAREAEKTHQKLFEKALKLLERGEDSEPLTYYTCSSCGYTFAFPPGASGEAGSGHPKNCPVCGAPMDKILAVE